MLNEQQKWPQLKWIFWSIFILLTILNIVTFSSILSLLEENKVTTKEIFSLTGTIGDTCGPIVSLIVGLISIYWIISTFNDQRKANAFSQSSAQFAFIYDNLNKIEEDLHNIQFRGVSESEGVLIFMSNFYNMSEGFEGDELWSEKRKIWDSLNKEEIKFLQDILFLLRRISNTSNKLNSLNLNPIHNEIVMTKLKEITATFLSNYIHVFIDINKLDEIKIVPNSVSYNKDIVHINFLISYKKSYNTMMDDLVRVNILTKEPNKSLSLLKFSNMKINLEELNRLDLDAHYSITDN